MASDYDVSVFLDPNNDLSSAELERIHNEMKQLGQLCFPQLPRYQVFVPDIHSAFFNKHVALLRHHNRLVGFISAMALPHVEGIEQPVVHTGLVVIHPEYRRSNAILQHLYGNLFVTLLMRYPRGLWLTCLAEVVSSLVNIAIYAKDVYPSPHVQKPGPAHLRIASAVDASYRAQMLISPEAVFDRNAFVFRGSNDHDEGRVFMKDVDDRQFWHRDDKASEYFRKLLSKNGGDEVLQVGFLDAEHLRRTANAGRHNQRMKHITSKL
jgi:hypothetical protein